MASTFGRIETLMRGLQAQQRAVDTSSHNIANASTPGFSRQRVDLTTSPPYTVPSFNGSPAYGQIGTGVSVASISRMRDGFLDLQYRAQSQRYGEASARAGVYGQLEVVFNEPQTAGLNNAMDRFWSSWQSLVNNPDDPSTRAFVVEEASNLASNINRVRQQITMQRDNTVTALGGKIDEVNQIAHDIASLNQQISVVQGVGQQPNDLMDSRDQLLDRLSQLTGTSTVTTPDGSVNVYFGGRALVDRQSVNEIAVDSTGSTAKIVWKSDGTDANASSGEIGGLLSMVNVDLPQALGEIDTMRDAIVNQVNGVHRTGYGLGDPAGVPPGRDFFEVLPNGDMQVRSEIADDPSKIAASGEAGVTGNADIALAIANVRYSRVLSGSTASISDYYNSMVARIGGKARQASSDSTNQDTLVQTIDRQRREVSEVSLDEEAANMIKFQHAYAAAARAMTTVDEMLSTVINNMGVVGR
jgi:flagellar hook-associated protein 1 FlgK